LPFIYIDIEMNSLEDAYVSIARAEERLHAEDGREPIELVNDQDSYDRFSSTVGQAKFFVQIFALFVKRMKQFSREPRTWFMLASPFITAIFSFLILQALLPGDDDENKTIWLIVSGFVFALWMLIGFCVCSGVFIIHISTEKELNLRYLTNFMGLGPMAYYCGNFMADLVLFMMPTLVFILITFPM
jgi:hypothetical protein